MKKRYSTGITNSVSTVEKANPQTMLAATGPHSSDFPANPNASEDKPAMVVPVVIKMAMTRRRAAYTDAAMNMELIRDMTQTLAIGLGTQELVIILVIVLLLFGGAKIPQLMRGVGKGVGELQKGLEEGKKSFQKSVDEAKLEDDDPKPDSTATKTA